MQTTFFCVFMRAAFSPFEQKKGEENEEFEFLLPITMQAKRDKIGLPSKYTTPFPSIIAFGASGVTFTNALYL